MVTKAVYKIWYTYCPE